MLAGWSATACDESSARVAGVSNPTFRTTYEGGLVLYAAGSFDDAAAVFAQAYALERRPEPLYMLGRAYHHLGRYAAAAAAYEGFLSMAPAHAAARAARVHLREALRGSPGGDGWVPAVRP